MTLRHIGGRDDWYVIDTDYGKDDGRPRWQHRRMSLHGPNVQASAEWNLLAKHGFGLGFEAGRNGGESDLGLNLYAGRLASLWLRLRAPWTSWVRVSKEKDPKGWYNARHTGLRLFPHEGCFLSGEFEAYEGHWSRSDPWWRRWSLTKTTLLGRSRSDAVTELGGATVVPMPEGVYDATWERKEVTTSYVRWPGTWLDKLRGPRPHRWVNVNVEGGIPVEGKGESSYDCGMDGLFGCSGATVEEAVGNAVKFVLRDRQRYGGPHDLDRPMTVQEAAAR